MLVNSIGFAGVQRTNKHQTNKQNNISFKSSKLETFEELASKKGELKTYYQTAQNISNFIVENTKKLYHNVQPLINEPLNPLHDRIPFNGSIGLTTTVGGTPESLFTPLGKMRIIGGRGHSGNASKTLMAQLTEKLGLVEILPKDKSGTTTYAITKDLKGNTVPQLKAEDIGHGDFKLNFQASRKLLAEILPERR